MTNLIQSFRRRPAQEALRSGFPQLSLDTWASYFNLGGPGAGTALQTTLGGRKEEIGGDLRGYIDGAYKSNGIVFACILSRLLVFSEARFQFQQVRSGRPGDLFGSPALKPLEQPWPNGTTGDLLARMIQDSDLAGNFYAARRRDLLRRMRPDWVTIIMGSDTRPEQDATIADLDVEVLGYAYHPKGPQAGADPVILLREEVAHFAPIPDPSAVFRGMSWLTPVLGEILADGAASEHKLQFFENGATPNMIVSYDKDVRQEQANLIREKIREKAGNAVGNAYETMVLGGGADVQVVGANMQQIDFKVTQGHGETRIAAAAGVPPIIVGLSEGLEAATYANYGQAKRRFADGTMRPLWRNAAGSLASVIQVPGNARLWFDDRDIPFLQEDVKDAADIQQTQAVSIKQLVEAGYEPASVIDAVTSGDLRRLTHTGLFSVQLQEAGAGTDPVAPATPPVPAVSGANGRRLLEQFTASRY